MRAILWIGIAVLATACGSSGSKESDPPVVIVDGSNNTMSNTSSNAANNDDPNNTTPNNGGDNNVTMQQSLEQSGSRYKAKVLQSQGGAQTFIGWYDNELEVDCGLSSSDGKCLPSTVTSVQRDVGVSSQGTIVHAIFSDPSCGNLIGVSTNGQGCIDIGEGDYIGLRGNEMTNCQGQRVSRIEEYARILGPYDGAAYRLAGDACEPDDGVERYEVGELIPRTSIPGWTQAVVD